MFMLDSAALPILPTREPKLVLQASLLTGRINLEQQNLESRTIYNRDSQCYKPVYCIQTNLQKYKFNPEGSINGSDQMENLQKNLLLSEKAKNIQRMQKATSQCSARKHSHDYLQRLLDSAKDQLTLGAFLSNFCIDKQLESDQNCPNCISIIQYEKKKIQLDTNQKKILARTKMGLQAYNPSVIESLKVNFQAIIDFPPHDVQKVKQSSSSQENEEFLTQQGFKKIFKNLRASRGIIFQELQKNVTKISQDDQPDTQKYLIWQDKNGLINVKREKLNYTVSRNSWLKVKEMLMNEMEVEDF